MLFHVVHTKNLERTVMSTQRIPDPGLDFILLGLLSLEVTKSQRGGVIDFFVSLKLFNYVLLYYDLVEKL